MGMEAAAERSESSRGVTSTACTLAPALPGCRASPHCHGREASRLRLLDADSVGKLQPGYASPTHGSAGGIAPGLVLAVDGGTAVLLPPAPYVPSIAPAMSVRFGRQFRSGLTLLGRWDDLGALPSSGVPSNAQIISFAARYAFPYFWPLPYAEVAAGLAFVNTGPSGPPTVTVGASAAIGLSLPIVPFLAVEVTGRDWFVFPAGFPLVQIPAVQASLAVVIPLKGP